MVGEQEVLGDEFLDRGEEGFEGLGIVEVGGLFADLIVDLGEGAAAEAVFALAEIDEQEVRADVF